MTYEFAAGSAQLGERKLRFMVTFAASIVLAVTHASAQSPLEVDRIGIQQHRDYLRLQPFEQIDTGSSNLILTLPQLTLPSNAGTNLTFQLTYNSNTDVSPNPYPDWPWRFGIAGVPMQVIREGYYPTGGFMNTLPGTEPYTPVLRMADGAIYRTVYANPTPAAGPPATMYEVRTSQFWKYHQDLHTLEMPDGRVFTYEAYQPGPGPGTSNLRLIHIEDVFGNTVDLGWSPGELDVVQTLRDGTSRTVHFTMNETTGLPLTMTFNDGVHDRVWDYLYEGGQAADTTGRLTSIDPPELQSDWIFVYNDFEGYRRLWHLTTPQSGMIEYDYLIKHFTLDGQPEYTRAFLHTRNVFDRGSNTSAGQWVIDCTMFAGGSFCDHTTILTPSAFLTYTYGNPSVSNPIPIIEGGVLLTHVKIQDPTGANTFEDEDVTYTGLSVVGSTYGTAAVSERAIQRNIRGYTTTMTYGDFGLPTHIFEVGDVSRTTERTYAPATSTPYLAGLLTSENIVVGSEAVHRDFTPNAQGFVTSATEPGVPPNLLQMSFTPDDGGNTASVTRRGLTTSYTYSHGTVATISTPLTSTVRTINLDGTIASESQGGRTTTFGYDLLSRVTSVQPPGGTNPTITEYDVAGTWIRTTRGASVTKTTLDGFGRPTLIETGVGADLVKRRTEYDAEGRVVYEGYPVSASADVGVHIEYDSLGHVTRRINPSATFSTYTYGPGGSVVITDENGHHTTQTWDAFGDPDDARLLSVLDADNKLWAYEYHVLGELAKVTAVGGVTRTWVYNSRHLLESETHPESGTTIYAYDSEGRLTQKTDANATTTTYTYDADNRIQMITAGSRVTTIGYEANSDNRAWISTGVVGTTFLYDDAGRLRRRQDVIDGKLFNSKYEYVDDNLSAIVYPSGRRIEYEPNGEGQIRRVFETATGRDYAIGMTYHPSGALATMLTNNGTATTTNNYDPQRYWPTTVTSGPVSLTYSNYDGVGNVGTITDSSFGDQSFTYDVLDRLSTATGSYGSIAYAYDAHGNRQTNANGTYEINANTLRLTAQGGIAFTYDNNGNLLSHGPANYTYTPQNMLETATVVGGTTTYTYDADDWRVKRSTSGSTSYYLRGPNGELLEEWKDPGTPTGLIRDYIYAGSRLLSRVDKSTTAHPNNICGVIVIGGAPVTVSAIVDQNPCLTFEGTAGQRVSILVNDNSISTSGWSILKPNQTVLLNTIVYGLPFGNPWSFIEPQTLDSPGTYTLGIDPWFANAGSVTLTLMNVPPDPVVPITPGGPPRPATTTVAGQNAHFTFTGTEGQRVSALLGNNSIPFSWYSLAPTGGPNLASDALWSCCWAFIEPRTVTTPGPHELLVDPTWTNTGSVTLWLYDVPPDVVTPITPGGPPVTVSLTAPGQNARLTFTGTAGQRVSVLSNNNTIPFSGFALVKPDGWNLFAGDMYGGQTGFMDAQTLPVTGTYTLVVNPSWTNTGSVTLTLYAFTDQTASVTIGGSPAAMTFTTPGQNATVTFAGTSGQQATVHMTNNAIGWTGVTLRNPDGGSMTSTSWVGTSFDLQTQTLPTTGTYTIEVDPSWGGTGSIAVSVTSP